MISSIMLGAGFSRQRVIYKTCSELVPPLRFPDVDLAELTPYAVQLRYDFEFWLDRETVQQALHIAECVRVAVLATVPQQATREYPVLSPARPEGQSRCPV